MRHNHGMSNLPEYKTWMSMRKRCNNPRNDDYANYGGRGIQVCPRWNDFAVFLSDMGKRPSSRHSIDRIDNSGNYEPGNCRWATQVQQCLNKRNNQIVRYHGSNVVLAVLCDEAGISIKTVRNRLAGNWTVEAAIDTPAAKSGHRFRMGTREYRSKPKGQTNFGFAPESTASLGAEKQ